MKIMSAKQLKYMLAWVVATMLTGCHTTQTAIGSIGSVYDERPENKQPVLERPAWPNYDLHDDRSFAAFSHIQTAPKESSARFVERLDGSSWSGSYTLYRCQDATYLCYDYTIPSSQDWWFWRFTSGSAIIDADTGDRYVMQRLEHFPMDQCFWTYGQSRETIRFVQVYPPLPLTVKRIQIYEASAESRRWMDGRGMITKPIEVDKLRPQGKLLDTIEKNKQKNKGRIIR